MPYDLKGKVALVTGGGSGIGRACALAFARAGASLLLVGRDRDKLRAVGDVAGSSGENMIALPLDLTHPDASSTLAAAVRARSSRLDILIHSAGTFQKSRIADTPDHLLRAQLEVNAVAPFALTRDLLPLLVEASGQVVFMNSSVVGSRKADVAAYSASKHALGAIADSFRQEVNTFGIRVLSVFIGRTASPMQERITREEGRRYVPSALLQPDDIASIVLAALTLPLTAEVTDLHIRPMRPPEGLAQV